MSPEIYKTEVRAAMPKARIIFVEKMEVIDYGTRNKATTNWPGVG
jgi:hypothetical protein